MTKYDTTGIHYANTVHGQPNVNASDADRRVDWSFSENACAYSPLIAPKGSASSHFLKVYHQNPKTAKEKLVTEKPWTFTGIGYKLDIPSCAYINKITFTVRIKVTGKIDVKAPLARFNFYNGSKSVKNTIKNDTGWDDGYYYYNPNKKLSNSWQSIEYVMTGDEFRRRGYPISELMEERMGIDLKWYNPSSQSTDNTVYIQYMSCKVDYELPDQKITFDQLTTGDNPKLVNSGETYNIQAIYENRSNAKCCGGTTDRQIKVNLPPNAKVVQNSGNYNPETSIWTVHCTPNSKETLNLGIKDYGIGNHPIDFNNDELGHNNYWVYSLPVPQDIGEVTPYPQVMIKGIQSCIRFESKVNASDGEANFTVNMDVTNNSARGVVWRLDDKTSDGVEISSSSDTHINFTVPRNKVVDIVWYGCFIPTFSGDSEVSVRLSGTPTTRPYRCVDAPIFEVTNNPKTREDDYDTAEIKLNPSIIYFETHRVATSTELGAYVIDCGVAPFDSMMEINDCTLTAGVWRKRNYIGMVELKYPHYDPDSDFENKEIFNSYKNKTYAGKEGSINEDISLKFKAPPKDTVTLQGLVELDKPTPINTNWQIWEGDPLNHRGWAVFSKLHVEKTNPLWYDCEATVKYITHDINTKFQIFKELPVNNVDMPTILADTVTLGENLSTVLDVFDIDTDGGFVYDDEGEEGAKNLFSLDEGQTLSIKTKNPLGQVSKIRFDWYSNLINEIRENNIERIYRIRDKDGNSIFEYEYTDFVFEEEYVICTVIMRIKDAVEGWITHRFVDVDLKTSIEADPIADTDFEEEAAYDISVDDETDSFVNLEEIITDITHSSYDADALIAGYNDEDIRKIVIKVKDKETYLFNQPIPSSESYDVVVSDISLTGVENDDIISFTCYDRDNAELTEYSEEYLIEVNSNSIQFFGLDDENGDAYEEGYIAPDFNPQSYDITFVYGSSLEFEINKNTLKVYDAGYNGREVVKEDITLIDSSYTFESVWTNLNQDGMTEDIISYIDVGLSETVLSATYSEYYSDLIVSPFPIPNKKVVFTRESEEGTIYYLTGQDPFKYRLEPFYQYLCGTDLVTREGSSMFNLNNSHTYFYIENGLVRLGFNKYSGSLYLAKWDIISKNWITTHYLHMGEDIKFSLEKYSDDKIVIKAGNDTYFSIWRGHPYIMIQNQNTEISIDSKFTHCLSDMIDGETYPYPVIASFMNDSNLLPVCIGGRTLDYDCISIEDDIITPGTNHTITITPPLTITAGEETVIPCTVEPSTNDGTVHYLLDGEDIGVVEAPFVLNHRFPDVANDVEHTLQAVYTGDEDDNIAISDIIPIVIKSPEAREDTIADTSYPEITGKYTLKMVSAPSKFTYRDGKAVVLELLKGGSPVRMPIEVQRAGGQTTTEYTNNQGLLYIYNKSFDVGKYQWGGRFYDEIDSDHDGKLMLSALKWINVEKAKPTFTHNASTGKINKGKYWHVKLNGVDSIANPNKAGLKDVTVSYTIDGGSKKTKKTNDKGKIYIKMNEKKTHKITLMFAGTKNYESIKKSFTIKVV